MNKKGAISIFALLSMMFFLMFIMAAYNNIMQKGKTQKESEGVIASYYKKEQSTASTFITSLKRDEINGILLKNSIKGTNSIDSLLIDTNANKYLYFNNGVYKIKSPLYQQVEYIESTGTQYINTGILSTSENCELFMEFEYVEKNGTYGGCLFASENGPQNTWSIFYNGAWFGMGKTNLSSWRYNTNISTKYKFDIVLKNGTGTFNLNDVTYTQTYTVGNIDAPIYLCADNVNNTSANQFAKIKIYKFRYHSNDALIRNMIPCYRKSDNVIGMYDTVGNVFYTNAGTGTFVKGPNV